MRPITFARATYRLLLTLSFYSLILCSAYSQTTRPASLSPLDTEQRCLSVRQLAKIADSLAVLPYVREDAAYWRQGAQGLQNENSELRAGARKQGDALLIRGLELSNEQQKNVMLTHKARKRGLLNWLLVSGIALFTGYKLTH